MILRRLVVAGDPTLVVDLHPRVTVVRGLSHADRARLVAAVTMMFSGLDPTTLGGVVELEGAEFAIEPDLFELVDLPTNLPDIVIRGGDLKRVLAIAEKNVVTTSGRRAELEVELEQLDRRFGTAASRRAEAADIADLYATDAAEALESPGTVDQEDVEDHEEAGYGGTFVPEREGWTWTTPNPGAPGDLASGSARADEIETEIAEIRRRLEELDAHTVGSSNGDRQASVSGPERVAVSAALEAFRWVRSWLPEAPPETMALAEQVGSLRREQSLARRDEVPEWLRAQARQQLEEAQAELSRAEREVRPQPVPQESAAALEAAHAAVDDAEERAQRRMAGPITTRRLAAARAHEEEILQELGLPSYAAYLLLRASSGNVDADGEQRLAAARAALDDAEAMWAEVSGEGVDVDLDALRDQERDLRAQALEVLGPDAAIAVSEVTLERLETLLREQRMPAPDWRPAAEGLVEALLEAGVDVPPFVFSDFEGDYDQVEDIAAAWLAAGDEATGDDAFHDVERTRETLLAELDRLDRELELELERTGLASVSVGEPDVVFEEQFVAETVVAVEAERPLSATERLRLLRDQTTAQLDSLAAEVSALARDAAAEPEAEADAELEEIEAEASDLAGAIEQAEDEARLVDEAYRSEVDEYLAGRFAAVRETGSGGPLPLLFDEILEGQPEAVADVIFNRVADESHTVQTVMLSDDERVAEWARSLGDGAAVVDTLDEDGDEFEARDEPVDEVERDAGDEPPFIF